MPYYVPHTKVAKEDATLNVTSNLGFLRQQEPLVQKLIIVPLYIQCEPAGGGIQCAASLYLTSLQHMLTFLRRAYKRARRSQLSYLLLYWLLPVQS